MNTRWKLALCLLVAWMPVVHAASEQGASSWKVRGAGFWDNRSMGRQLEALFSKEGYLSHGDVEDGAMILLSMLQQSGYLDVTVEAQFFRPGSDTPEVLLWDRELDTWITSDQSVSSVEYRVTRGPRFYFRNLVFDDLDGLSDGFVASFFYGEALLFQRKESRMFSRGGFSRGLRNLEAYLRRKGYQDAMVEGMVVAEDWEQGAVDVAIRLKLGELHRLESISWDPEHGVLAAFPMETWLGRPYSGELRQDIIQDVRNRFYELGYPDVAIRVISDEGEPENLTARQLRIAVISGTQVRVGALELEGMEATRLHFVRSRIQFRAGDFLDPTKLDQSRLTVAQSGVFSRVDVRTEPMSEEERRVVFTMQERDPWTLDLLAGWGTYEMARAGFMVERGNLWGIGQRLEFKSVVSMKSFLSETRYTVPDAFRSRISVTFRAFTLDREEVAFDRIERGIDVALNRRLSWLLLDSSLVYAYNRLESQDRQQKIIPSREPARVASLALRLNRDTRNSPINPTRGYRVFGAFEWADGMLGSEVSYRGQEFGFSNHHPLGNGLYFHTGLQLGLIASNDNAEGVLPNNKLFFPGGDHSNRGYQRGEAAPVDELGAYQGARAFATVNVELEQMLSRNFSVVAFYDGTAINRKSRLTSPEAFLGAVGIGLRWKTVMGPLRLEYGHNLNRRPAVDPSGTLQFALGFPF